MGDRDKRAAVKIVNNGFLLVALGFGRPFSAGAELRRGILGGQTNNNAQRSAINDGNGYGSIAGSSKEGVV